MHRPMEVLRVKADPAVQRRLLELADVDAELARVDHRRRTLPELAEIAEAEKSVRAREDRDRALMAGGTVSPKQMTDLEHELTTLQRRQTTLEDDLLELMERREAVALDGQHTAAELSKAEETLTEAANRRDQALVDLETTWARRTADRERLAPTFPAPLTELYERVRKNKGIGAALLRARRCG